MLSKKQWLRVHETQLIWEWAFICCNIEPWTMSWRRAQYLSIVIWCWSTHQVMLLFLKMLHLKLVAYHILLLCSVWIHRVHLLLINHLIIVYVVSLASKNILWRQLKIDLGIFWSSSVSSFFLAKSIWKASSFVSSLKFQ